MKFIVAQVAPELCLTKENFIDTIDRKIDKIINNHNNIDLIIFPEALGLWMCMMEPTTWLSKVFSRFLHTHKNNAIKMCSWASDNTKDYSDEIIANIQFSRPDINIKTSNIDNGLLDPIFYSYYIKNSQNEMVKKCSIDSWLISLSNWIFNKLPLKFLAQYMRSNEMLSAYKEAFSSAAQKYNVYIQAGSLFERVVGGTKNAAYAFAPDGSIVCRQEKWHPIAFEGMLGIKAGSGHETFDVKGIKCGIAICNDLGFSNDLVAILAADGCQFIAAPSGGIVPSHMWKFDYKRDVENCQQARANESDVVIGRSYNAGDLLLGVLKFQGLSTIVEPGGLVAMVPKENIRDEYNLEHQIEIIKNPLI